MIEPTPASDQKSRTTGHKPIENLDCYLLFEEVADCVWRLVKTWESFERRTIGEQFVEAADSVGANLAEGDGRYSKQESIQFFRIARASARETRNWLRKCIRRGLCDPSEGQSNLEKINQATKLLNLLINYRIKSYSNGKVLKELIAHYGAAAKTDDPFSD